MTIYAPSPPAFRCAICSVEYIPTPFGWSPDLPIPPLCRWCNNNWGRCIGGIGDRNRDRRIMRMISALAEAIQVEACRIERGEGPIYGRA